MAATLDAIGQGSDPVPLVRYFEVWLLKLSGFFPDLKRCAGCERQLGPEDTLFLTPEGMPRCEDCSGGHGMRIGPGLRATIARVLAEAGSEPTIVSAELDPAAVDEARQRLWIYRDRRPDLYEPLVRPPGTMRP